MTHKLQWNGHVSHSFGLAKTILKGTVKGGKQNGQKKRSEDITEQFANSQNAVENGEKWRKLAVKLAVVPK